MSGEVGGSSSYAEPSAQSRRFELHRDLDVTGISGTGVVADGVDFPDGLVVVHWRGRRPSTVTWQGGISDVVAVHGHGGHTRIVWLDPA